MPRDKDFKRYVRGRMRTTGERYTEAREAVRQPLALTEWRLTGERKEAYQLATSADPQAPGGRVATLRATGDPGHGFGGLIRDVPAAAHRGRRVRLSAVVRAEDVTGWAGLWMRVDDLGRVPLAFGSTQQERPLRGSTGWEALAVVLDVPPEAEAIALGAILHGRGVVRVAAARLEHVPDTFPVSGPAGVSGWMLDGTARHAYELVVEPDETPAGSARIHVLRSVADPGSGFASMSRVTAASPHRGRRLRLSALLRGGDVRGGAGLWMRVDSAERTTLAFDNMQDRLLRGTFDWIPVAVVLAVAPEAAQVAYGVLLSGSGTVRAAGARLEHVDDDVPTTDGAAATGWTLSGSRRDAYESDLAPGRREAILRSIADPGTGFGTLAQMFLADHVRERTVRFRAVLHGEGDGSQVVVWLRVDGVGGKQLTLDNQPEPALRGTFGRRELEIVREVPPEAVAIAFGVVLAGHGTVRMSDVRFDVVDGGVETPATGPVNLDFAEVP
jgi:hypothetical protein